MSPSREPRVSGPNGRNCHHHITELSKHLYCSEPGATTESEPSSIKILECVTEKCLIVSPCDCFWHHFLFMRYSIRNRICWEEFVNSLVIRFYCFYQRSNGGVEMSDMHACGFLPVMMRHWIPDSLTLALLLVLSQTGFKPLFDSFFRARRSLSKLMTYKKLMQHASVIIFRWASRREL